jgi:hypothetical protein
MVEGTHARGAIAERLLGLLGESDKLANVFTGKSLRTTIAMGVCPTSAAKRMSSGLFLAAATPNGV